MLIKPWTDQQAPRHLLDDEEDASLIPEVKVQFEAQFDSVIIVPKTLKVVIESITDKKQVGTVSVKYPEISDIVEKYTDEYDEDEQLYAAIMERSLKDKYTEMEIPIYQYGKYVMIVVPHITNAIGVNVLGSEIASHLAAKNWIILSPSHLNNGETVNKMTRGKCGDIVDSVPDLKPPHFITGIAASVMRCLGEVNLTCLVLNAEGQSGFEKLDNDSIIDTSHILSDLLKLDEKYLKSVSSGVRKFNGYSNSGMYI